MVLCQWVRARSRSTSGGRPSWAPTSWASKASTKTASGGGTTFRLRKMRPTRPVMPPVAVAEAVAAGVGIPEDPLELGFGGRQLAVQLRLHLRCASGTPSAIALGVSVERTCSDSRCSMQL